MLKALFINSTPRSQKALQKVEALAAFTGMSKSQAAVFLIEHAPAPVAAMLDQEPAHVKTPHQ